MQEELRDALASLQVIDYDLGELERSKEYIPDMMENLKHEKSDESDKQVTESAEQELIRFQN